MKFLNLACILSLFLVNSRLHCQDFSAWDIPIYNNGQRINSPFTGGLKAGQFSKTDLDNDGKSDLVVFDRSGGKVVCYLNKGGVGEINYEHAPSFQSIFPIAETFMLLYDFNKDGVEDIFKDPTGTGIAGIEVWRGRRDATGLHYTKVRNKENFFNVLFYTAPNGFPVNVYNSIIDLPGIADVDSDGDTDILGFDQDGGYINYYRNMAVERGLGIDTFDMFFPLGEAEHKCWGKVYETMSSSEVLISPDSQTCPVGLTHGGETGQRHAGSTVTAFDKDCDGDIDLILGDFLTDNIVYLQNNGTAQVSHVTSQDATYPSVTPPLFMSVFLSSFVLDINNDGKRDLIVTPNQQDVASNTNHVWLYLNEGEQCNPNFKLHTKTFLVDQMLHFGRQSHPVFCDFNSDQKMDILVGSGGLIVAGSNANSKRIFLLQNIGTNDAPAYNIVNTDYLKFSTNPDNVGTLSPTIVDINGDGDDDLFVGNSDGNIYYFENIAAPNMPYDLVLRASEFSDIDVGSAANPTFYDYDGDGDFDLITGESNSELNLYANSGTKSVPNFSNTFAQRVFGTVYIGNDFFNSRCDPLFFKSKESSYFLHGTDSGKLRLFGDVEKDTFKLINESYGGFIPGRRSTLDLTDIDGNRYYDLVLGSDRGGIQIYRTPLLIEGASSIDRPNSLNVSLYPNPVRDYLYINCESEVSYLIYDLHGRLVKTGFGNRTVEVNMNDLNVGIYFYHILDANKKSRSGKIIKIGNH